MPTSPEPDQFSSRLIQAHDTPGQHDQMTTPHTVQMTADGAAICRLRRSPELRPIDASWREAADNSRARFAGSLRPPGSVIGRPYHDRSQPISAFAWRRRRNERD